MHVDSSQCCTSSGRKSSSSSFPCVFIVDLRLSLKNKSVGRTEPGERFVSTRDVDASETRRRNICSTRRRRTRRKESSLDLLREWKWKGTRRTTTDHCRWRSSSRTVPASRAKPIPTLGEHRSNGRIRVYSPEETSDRESNAILCSRRSSPRKEREKEQETRRDSSDETLLSLPNGNVHRDID